MQVGDSSNVIPLQQPTKVDILLFFCFCLSSNHQISLLFILQSWSFMLPKWNFSLCLGTCYSISIIFVLNSRILQIDMQWVYNQCDSEFEYRKWEWINFRDGSKGWVWECCRCGSQVWMEWKMGRSFSLIQQHMIACMLSILVGLALGLSISSPS
jgi:hypothetical protein